jgi:adenine-specific DNA methylase
MPNRSQREREPPASGADPELALAQPPALIELGLKAASARRAIEDEAFPFEALSEIAEIESWRKEISRPVTHIHKWWAQRLGTVFRAIILGTFAPAGSDILSLFYARTRVTDAVIFDPFMGSGTTIVETLKLRARAIGRDINPVAHFAVRNALAKHDRQAVLTTFASIKCDVADDLRPYYVAELDNGHLADVLYFFWVKVVPCPKCSSGVDLFGSYIFAQHAYPRKYPEARALCPHCGAVNATRYDAVEVCCSECHRSFDPRCGPASGIKARCSCGHEFPIAKTVRENGRAPDHRLYAKLVLLPDGRKRYMRATAADEALYAKAAQALAERQNAYPIVEITPGYNTNQALGYNYRYWHQMFNARQLLGLSILGERISQIPEPLVCELFMCLFSGTLEFNNMFASYKGEGTGAVRHMFYHHILKPERVPLEANLWGTPKSSGSFSTLFESRLLRALDYADDPFEIRLAKTVDKVSSSKVFGLSEPIGHARAQDLPQFETGARLYLSCGDSSKTDMPTGSVDAIITDPPFFDNVHYSQLADFFHVWQRHFLGGDSKTTRADGEVQHSDGREFTERLGAVWGECHRVLRDDGLLVFTYHHSRPEGWACVLAALMKAGFIITAAHPIKAEMSVATPKHQAKEPIDLDIILVCRKRSIADRAFELGNAFWSEAIQVAEHQIIRLRRSGRGLSRNDLRVIVMAQLLRSLSRLESAEVAMQALNNEATATESVINSFA